MTEQKTNAGTCAECRHHSAFKRQRIIDATGFDDQLMFEDEDKDETVYICKAPGGKHFDKEIGTVPITCDSFEVGVKSALEKEQMEALDRLERAYAERTKQR